MFSHLLRKMLAEWIQQEIRQRNQQLVNPTPVLRDTYTRLCAPIRQWAVRDYEELAVMMDTSASTLQRIFGHLCRCCKK